MKKPENYKPTQLSAHLGWLFSEVLVCHSDKNIWEKANHFFIQALIPFFKTMSLKICVFYIGKIILLLENLGTKEKQKVF